jgi:hypothetical protein
MTAATAAEREVQPRCAGCARPIHARRAHQLPDTRRYLPGGAGSGYQPVCAAKPNADTPPPPGPTR